MRVAPVRINQIQPNFCNTGVKPQTLPIKDVCQDVFVKSVANSPSFKGISKGEEAKILIKAGSVLGETYRINSLLQGTLAYLEEQINTDMHILTTGFKDNYESFMKTPGNKVGFYYTQKENEKPVLDRKEVIRNAGNDTKTITQFFDSGKFHTEIVYWKNGVQTHDIIEGTYDNFPLGMALTGSGEIFPVSGIEVKPLTALIGYTETEKGEKKTEKTFEFHKNSGMLKSFYENSSNINGYKKRQNDFEFDPEGIISAYTQNYSNHGRDFKYAQRFAYDKGLFIGYIEDYDSVTDSAKVWYEINENGEYNEADGN